MRETALNVFKQQESGRGFPTIKVEPRKSFASLNFPFHADDLGRFCYLRFCTVLCLT